MIDRLRQIPGVKIGMPKGAFYAYPNISCAFGRNGVNTPMQFAEKLLADRERCRRSRGSIRYDGACSDLVRRLDGRIEPRPRSSSEVRRERMQARPRRVSPIRRTSLGQNGCGYRSPSGDENRRGLVSASSTHFPLLVKFLFTDERLSVQVHPDDEFAARYENSRGKTEMWHILAAEPDGQNRAGIPNGSE